MTTVTPCRPPSPPASSAPAPRSPRSASAAWGCRSSTERADEAEAIATIHRALELGVTFFDTADMYGPFTNERLVGGRSRPARRGGARHEVRQRAGEGRPYVRHQREARYVRAPATPRSSVSGGPHRPLLPAPRRPGTPIEETVGAMAELVGKGRCGTSGSRRRRPRPSAGPTRSTRSPRSRPSTRCGPGTPRRRSSPPCRELGIGFVPYSPLGRGFLTGRIRKRRRPRRERPPPQLPAIPGESFARNVEARGAREGDRGRERVTAGAARARWVLAQGEDIVPIPGTKRGENLEENARRLEVELSAEDLRRLEEAVPGGAAAGTATRTCRA